VTDVDIKIATLHPARQTSHDPVCYRELYYQNVGLVGSQRLLDSAVRDICSLLNVPAWDLGVTAMSKGLIAGPVSLIMESGDVIDCMAPGGESCWILESV
jgi:DNA topoisomerase VI subunit A